MKTEIIVAQLEKIYRLLLNKEYQAIYLLDLNKRISAVELKRVIDDYIGELTYPPEEKLADFDLYNVNNNHAFVESNLWFDDQQSDLTISLTIQKIKDEYFFAIDDLRVL